MEKEKKIRVEIRPSPETYKWLQKRIELREDGWKVQDEILMMLDYIEGLDRRNGFRVR